jgi:hypothetical protein
LDVVLALSGLLPLIAWAVGISRLPSGSSAQVGLWLIAVGSLAIVLGAGFEFAARRGNPGPANPVSDTQVPL